MASSKPLTPNQKETLKKLKDKQLKYETAKEIAKSNKKKPYPGRNPQKGIGKEYRP